MKKVKYFPFNVFGFTPILLVIFSLQTKEASAQPMPTLTAAQVLETIKANLNCPWNSETVDTFKAGNPNTPVTGIVTTFMATYPVLQNAVALNCNFIIAHEPTFYNHLDHRDWAGENDQVVADKLKFINDHQLVILRLHDHWHCNTPDGILVGMARQLGWTAYQSTSEPHLFTLPSITLKAFANELNTKFPGSAIRVVGDPELKISKVALVPGAPGSQTQIRFLQRDEVDVVVSGESPEWEAAEYVRDAATEGKPKALILIGHDNSEEAGMDYFSTWLKPLVPGIPVHFVPAGNPFWMPD